jgi:Mce-associated membrane protein
VPIVLLAALLAADAVLFFRPRGASTHDVVTRRVLAAARQEAVNLTTIAYTSAAHDLDRILAGATGGLRQQFQTQRAQFPSVLARDKSVSRGRVLSAGVISLSAANDTARVDVATDATVSTTGGGTTAQSVLKHYRMVMQLRLVHGQWLVSDVAFAGVPQ